jgi:hypothetical protein
LGTGEEAMQNEKEKQFSGVKPPLPPSKFASDAYITTSKNKNGCIYFLGSKEIFLPQMKEIIKPHVHINSR